MAFATSVQIIIVHLLRQTQMQIKQLVDSMEQNICWNKTSYHQTNNLTSSGIRENWNSVPYLCSSRFYVHAETRVFSEHAPYTLWKVHGGVRLGGLGMPNILSMQTTEHAQSTQPK